MTNREIADTFDLIADLLEVKGENVFRIRAYRNASLNLREMSEVLADVAKEGRLEELSGIGKDLASKIQELLATGRLEYLDRLKKEIPEVLATLMTIPGLGPKKAKQLYDHFKVKSMDHLEKLAKDGKLRALPGMGEKTESNILQGLKTVRRGLERKPLLVGLEIAGEIIDRLEALPVVDRIVVAGSSRRGRETIRDIDLLVVSKKPAAVMDQFVQLPFVDQVQAHGETKSSIRTSQGLQVDLRVVAPESFGAAWIYFTGSKAHNVKIRQLAQQKELLVNEYGVFRKKGNRRVAGKSEEEVYKSLGLPWVPPELREDRGEVEAGLKNRLPSLAEIKSMRGDFHMHSDWTDGGYPIEEVARAAKAKGYEYMLLTDHSQSLRIAGGLSAEKLLKQRAIVDKLNRTLKPFRVLLGTEMEILPDGSLDYDDSVLSQLDVVVAAVHSAFKQPKTQMTERIISAIRNPYVNIIAHPTGRLLGAREPYEVDLDEVAKEAARTGTALEINAQAKRMDLSDAQAKRAKELGAQLVVSTDAHTLDHLETMVIGVGLARRAWLENQDLLNTRRADEVLKWVAQKRRKLQVAKS